MLKFNRKTKRKGGGQMDKVIDIEERIPSMRERRRRRTNKKFIFILTVFVFALLLLLFFQSPYSKIRSIHIKGAHLYNADFYREKTGLSNEDSVFTVKTDKLKSKLEAIETVREATVIRHWNGDVTLQLQEWHPIALLEERGEIQLLLENGEPFIAERRLMTADAPIVTGFHSPAQKKRIAKQLMQIDSTVFQLLSEIKLIDEEDEKLIVFMDDGYEVHGALSSFAKKMEYYPEIIAQLSGHEKGVLDIEVGTFFKTYSEVYGANVEEEGEPDEGTTEE